MIDKIRLNMTIEPVVTDLAQIRDDQAKARPEQPGSGFLCELHRLQCA